MCLFIGIGIYWHMLENCRKFKTHHTLPLMVILFLTVCVFLVTYFNFILKNLCRRFKRFTTNLVNFRQYFNELYYDIEQIAIRNAG